MKYINKYNVNEAHKNESQVEDIIETVVDVIEEHNVTFKSIMGDMKYQDYLSKNSTYESFLPQVSTGKYLRSQFQLVFHSVYTYDKYVSLLDDMKSPIGRLSDIGWNMYDIRLGTHVPANNNGLVRITFVTFCFSKPDVDINSDWEVDEKEIKKVFDENGLVVTDIDITYPKNVGDETEVKVDFQTKSLHGELSRDMEKTFEIITDRIGFTSFGYTNGNYYVYFYY